MKHIETIKYMKSALHNALNSFEVPMTAGIAEALAAANRAIAEAEQPVSQEPLSIATNAPNLFGQVYLSCRANGNSHEGSIAAANEAVRFHGDDPVSAQDLTLIVNQVARG